MLRPDGARPVRVGHIRLVAAAELRDYLRHPQALRDLVLLPLLLLLMAFAPLAFVVDQVLGGLQRTEFDLAVEGDPALAPGLLQALAGGEFRLEPVPDAAQVVRADPDRIALVLSERPTQDGGPPRPTATILAFDPEGGVRFAVGALRLRIWQWSQEHAAEHLIAEGVAPELVRPVSVEIEAFVGTPAGTRLSVGFALPALIVFQLSSLATATIGRVGPRRARQVFEPQLVLPLGRVELVAGKGLAGAAIGLVGSAAVLVLLGGPLVLALVLAGGGPGISLAAAPGAAIGTALLAALFTATGLALGLRARSESEETFASLVVVLGAVASVALLITFGGGLPAAAAWLPGAGAVSVIRSSVLGNLSLSQAVTAAATTLAATGLLLLLAARRVGADRQVLRWR